MIPEGTYQEGSKTEELIRWAMLAGVIWFCACVPGQPEEAYVCVPGTETVINTVGENALEEALSLVKLKLEGKPNADTAAG